MSSSADRRRQRYAEDEAYRERVKAANRAAFKLKYDTDPVWREAYKEKMRLKRKAARAAAKANL